MTGVPRSRHCPRCDGVKAPSRPLCVACSITTRTPADCSSRVADLDRLDVPLSVPTHRLPADVRAMLDRIHKETPA